MFVEVLLFFVLAILIHYSFGGDRDKRLPPGPRGLPLLGNLPLLGQAPHKKMMEYGKKWGKIFTLKFGSFDVVVFNDIGLMKNCFKLHKFNGRPSDKIILCKLFSKGMAFNEGEHVVQQRRYCLKTLRDLGFGKKTQNDIMANEIEELISYFKTKIDEPIEIKRTFDISVINSLLYLVMGKKYSLHDPHTKDLIQANLDGIIEPSLSVINFLPWFARLFPKISNFDKAKKGIKFLEDSFQKIVDEHLETYDPENLRDFIDNYIYEIKNTTDPDSSFYKEEGMSNLLHCLCDFFSAGSDTSSTTIAWAVVYFLHYPKVMKKLQKELDEVIGSRLPNLSDRPNCPYAEAVMWELWRIASVVPCALYHSTTEDVEVEGYILPKRTIILPNLYSLHHDEEYWKDPEVFRPERFITPDGKFKKDTERLIPFSIGKRSCVAEHLAQNQTFFWLASLLQTFDFTQPEGHPLPTFDSTFGIVLSPRPFKVKLSLRKPA